MSFVNLPDGEPLYFEVTGSGPPLVLVTGLGGLAGFWQPHLGELTKHFKVITYDHRGVGQSSLKLIEFSVEQMADDLLCLLDHLDIDKVHIAGHSTGGAIGQVMAIEHGERLDRLMICASWPGKDPYFDLLFHARSSVLRYQGAKEYVHQTTLVGRPPKWLRDNPGETEMPGDDLVAMMMKSVECTLARIEAIRAFNRRADLGAISAPVLITCARDDIVTPLHLSYELGERIAGARSDIIDWGGHFYPAIRPDVFRKQAVDFLTTIEHPNKGYRHVAAGG